MKFTVLIPFNKKYISNQLFHDLKGLSNVRIKYLLKKEQKFGSKSIIDRIMWSSYWRVRAIKLLYDIIHDTTKDKNGSTILMTNEMLIFMSSYQLNKIRKHGNKVILIMIDPMSASYPSVASAKRILKDFKFDLIFTFDPNDAKKYRWTYCNTLYSKIVNEQAYPKYDICYFGNIKDRLSLMLQLLDETQNNNVSLLLKLTGCSNDQKQHLPSEVVLEKVLPYEDIIKMTLKANCIFDITQPGQSGVTFRYYEAIVYNKKLITNNRSIIKMPFYDERFIRFYDDICDVDWEWAKKKEIIDYGYNGEFSPLRLLSVIYSKYNDC